MTSRDAFRLYREKTRDKPAYERVYFFHAHIYYNIDDAGEVAKMDALHKTLQGSFSQDDHYEVHTLQTKPVGPHPLPNLEVLFTRDRFTEFVSYLTFTLPPTFSALIHQLTSDQLGDHTTRAMWLGKQLPLKPEILHKMDERSAAKGMSEEEIVWAVHAH